MRTAPGTDPVRLTGLKINWLSAVTRPAHEGAVALLLKRRDFDSETLKARHRIDDEALLRRRKRKRKVADVVAAKDRLVQIAKHDHIDQLAKFDDGNVPVVMTSSEEGASHLVRLDGRAGETTWQTSEGSERGHDHPWILMSSDTSGFSLVIGMSEGHSHTVDAAALNAAFAAAALSKQEKLEDDQMPKGNPTQKSAEEIAELETNLALAQLYGGLSDAERQHFQGLDEVAKVAFVQKSADARAADLIQESGADKLVYKGRDGTEYTAAHDPLMVKLAKRGDISDERAEKLEKQLDQDRLEKRAATELPNLPGEPAVKAAMLQAIEDIPDKAVREAAMASLRAGNAGVGLSFESLGTQAGPQMGIESGADDSAAGELEEMAKAYAKEHSVTKEVAMGKVVATPEGRQLYKAHSKKLTSKGQPIN